MERRKARTPKSNGKYFASIVYLCTRCTCVTASAALDVRWAFRITLKRAVDLLDDLRPNVQDRGFDKEEGLLVLVTLYSTTDVGASHRTDSHRVHGFCNEVKLQNELSFVS
jgi:hypothetical protein